MIIRKFKNEVNAWDNKKKFLKIVIDPDKSKFNVNHRKENNLRGSGSAGGYGYDRKSTAFEEAINNAGIFNFPKFAGSGDIKFAIETLCKIFNIKKYQIVEMFG